ncbi:immediate early response gene 5-like protein [Cryptotermes secundus]|uniref:immediate early response gene 5-like protein n=1 Tax=Cryptotermes secundus TaxID=105785 RepID=UPI001454DE18|nr:immediate early response gene 5-like protein [Cryptotermes secundus]
MAWEAERLMNISLTKLAESRKQRGGVSLHKHLMVVKVLKKARCIFKEELYNMVQSQRRGGYTSTTATTPQDQQQQDDCEHNYDDNGLVDFTPEEAGTGSSQYTTPHSEDASSGVNHLQLSASCVRCADNIPPSLPSYEDDKENQPRPSYHTIPASPQSDKSPAHGDRVLRHRRRRRQRRRTWNATSTSSPRCPKRRINFDECETEEADLTPGQVDIGSSQHKTTSTIPPKCAKICCMS